MRHLSVAGVRTSLGMDVGRSAVKMQFNIILSCTLRSYSWLRRVFQ